MVSRAWGYFSFLMVCYVIPCQCSGWLFKLQLFFLPWAARWEYDTYERHTPDGQGK